MRKIPIAVLATLLLAVATPSYAQGLKGALEKVIKKVEKIDDAIVKEQCRIYGNQRTSLTLRLNSLTRRMTVTGADVDALAREVKSLNGELTSIERSMKTLQCGSSASAGSTAAPTEPQSSGGSASGSNPAATAGSNKPLELKYNDRGVIIITNQVITAYLRAARARDLAGGDYWRAGGFSWQGDYARVEERIISFLKGTGGFEEAENAVLRARANDLRAAEAHNWNGIDLTSADERSCAQISAQKQEVKQSINDLQREKNKHDADLKEQDVRIDRFWKAAQRTRSGNATSLDTDVEEIKRLALSYNLDERKFDSWKPADFYLSLLEAAQGKRSLLEGWAHHAELARDAKYEQLNQLEAEARQQQCTDN